MFYELPVLTDGSVSRARGGSVEASFVLMSKYVGEIDGYRNHHQAG
jgi:hypothetical protein